MSTSIVSEDSEVLRQVAKALPNVQRKTFVGAEHTPHISHPVEYVESVRAFAR